MDWRPADVRAASLSDFIAAVLGRNEMLTGDDMTPAEKAALRADVWGG